MEVAENKMDVFYILYRHKDKNVGLSGYSHDGVYMKLGEIRMKSPESGKWYDSVVYQDIKKLEVYVREKNDFNNKFEEFKVWIKDVLRENS